MSSKEGTSFLAEHKNDSKESSYRSATAFEFRNHRSFSSLRSNLSANYIIRNKGFGSSLALQRTIRSRSAINFSKRPYSTILTGKTPQDAALFDASDEELQKPKRSLFTLARMGIVYFGIEVLFSLEIALTVPILLKLKVPEQ